MRILLVEDEVGLQDALGLALRREGYAVDQALTREDALQKLQFFEYDLVLLDLTLPDGDGFDVAEQIRSGRVLGGPRILMLTARGSLRDRVQGLDLGADDYLVKPFAIAELSARVRAVLRRDLTAGSAVLSNGPIVMDTARQLARRGDRELLLTLKEFGVLRYLLGRPGYVISAEELLEHVWDEHTDPFTQTVRVTVGTLRRKLSVDGEEPLLDTVIGRGYRLLDLSGAQTPGGLSAAGSGG